MLIASLVIVGAWLGLPHAGKPSPAVGAVKPPATATSVHGRPVAEVKTPTGSPAKAVRGSVVAKISDLSASGLTDRARPLGLPDIYVISVAVEQDIGEAVQQVGATPGVAAAGPDYLVTASVVPNDSLYGSFQWNMPKIGAPAAWNKTTGNSSTVIASIDTGVNWNHEDLAGKLWTNAADTPGNGLDDDANGYVDDTKGFDFVNGSFAGNRWNNSAQSAIDDEGHGTLTSSVMGAASNNGKGIAGASWGSMIMPVKALDTNGSGTLSDVAAGIRYAADNGAKVVNMSLGAQGLTADVATDAAIDYATSRGVVLVAASGNDGSSTTISYPAINPKVIAVGATDSGDNQASYSNAGSQLSLVAPGTGIASALGVMDQPSSLSVSVQNGVSSLTVGSYRYVVTAYNANGETIASTPPSGNPNQNLANVGAGQRVNVTWSSVYGATGYKLYRTATGGAAGTEKLLTDVGSATTFVDAGSITIGSTPPPSVNGGLLNTNYATASGTSLATPHVAGVAALLASLKPAITSDEVRTVLQDTADKPAGMAGQNRTNAYGYGRLNADRAVSAIQTYSAQWMGQSGSQTLYSGETATVYVDFKNVGTVNWSASGSSPVRLGTSHARDRASVLSGADWINAARPATFAGTVNNGTVMPATSVAPGQTGRFSFTIYAPAVGAVTTYREYFQPVAEGVAWLEDYGVYFDVTVNPAAARYHAQWVGQSGYPTLGAGDQGSVYMDYKNTGAANWKSDGANPVRLGASHTRDRASLFSSAAWPSATRAATFSGRVETGGSVTATTTIAPGETARFPVTLTAPPVGTTTNFNEYVQPVAEGITWMEDYGAFWSVAVTPKTYAYQLAAQSGPRQVPLGGQGPATVDLTNTGSATWRSDTLRPLRLGTARAQDRRSSFAASGWLSATRPATFSGRVAGGNLTPAAAIAPGETARFAFDLGAAKSGLYREYFQPVVEGFQWLTDTGIFHDVVVPDPNGTVFTYQYLGQSAPATVAPGGQTTLKLQIRNIGNQTWSSNGANAVKLGTDRTRDHGSPFYTAGAWLSPSRAHLTRNLSDSSKDVGGETSILPGDTAEFEFTATAPGTAGLYREYFTPVAEGVTWMNDLGIFWPITVQ